MLKDEVVARRPYLDSLLVHFVPLSASVDDDTKLAHTALQRFAPDDEHEAAISLARAIGVLKTDFLAAKPHAAEELALREGPLREQWEARGPGLLARMARLIGKEFIAAEAEVLLVHPVHGGGGAVHAGYNSVSFEAVLANPFPDLPEVVRLAWLLARLRVEQTLPASHTDGPILEQVVAVSLLPVVLTAAQEVELILPSDSIEPILKSALFLWRVEGVAPHTIIRWWEEQLRLHRPWPAALLSFIAIQFSSSPRSGWQAEG